MLIEFKVVKQFAKNDEIYNVNDIIEMEEAEAKSLVEAGKVEVNKEEKSVSVEVDSKAISEAIEKGFSRFAPAVEKKEETISYGEFLQKLANGEKVDKAVKIDKAGIVIGTDANGGYATTDYTNPAISAEILKQSEVTNRLGVVTLTGTNNTFKENVVTSVGTPAVVAEGGTISESTPVIKQYSYDLTKHAMLYYATDESLEDTGALVQVVNTNISDEFQKYIENGVINGSSALTAIVDNTNTVSVAPEAAQPIQTIVLENLQKMFSRIEDPARSVWIMSRSAWDQVRLVVDENGNALFSGGLGNSLSQSPYGTLLGLPIIVSPYCQSVGTSGDILLCDLSAYRFVIKSGLKTAMSDHVAFVTDKRAFRFTYRFAGGPQATKLTELDGTVTSKFVQLADRAQASDMQSSSSSSSS